VTSERIVPMGIVTDVRQAYKEIQDQLTKIRGVNQLLEGKYRQYYCRDPMRDREMDSSAELHLLRSWNSLCSISHQWDDLYWYQFKCEQGDSDSYSWMGNRENEIVEGSILKD